MDFIGVLRGVLGIVVLLAIAFLFSSNKKNINWRTVGVGMALQIFLAFLVLNPFNFKWLNWPSQFFGWVAKKFVEVLNFSGEGASFLFGDLVGRIDSFGYIFAFQVLPTIVFFSALSAVLYYFGILQFIVKGFAMLMRNLLGISGPESLAAAGNVFLGQTESPLLVKPYLKDMTESEILCLMCGGMATIAGGVFAAYVGYLGGVDEASKILFAKHLLTASVMSAPAAIVAAKILLPEKKDHISNTSLKIPKDAIGSNLLDAISKGTTDGLKLAVNVGAMLLVFTALIAFVNKFILMKIGGVIPAGAEYDNINDLIRVSTENKFSGFSLDYLFGLLFAPLAWLMGVASGDIMIVGQLLGQKTAINEFVAYATMGDLKESGKFASQKSVIIATYALCGFANFASIGIQIGGIGAIAPSQRKILAKYGFKALIGGTIACFLTATIAGVFY